MKILDRYILTQFAQTFASVFIIIFFIFILQSVWLYIGELTGKDLGIGMILQFLMFGMPKIVPLVLPLSVVLASIMTYGNFAEAYEFAAIKSSGISLVRSMRSLIVFNIVLAIVAFFFANNVIPYSEYKFVNFKVDIGKRQPAMAIAKGQFSAIGDYNIKVDDKYGPDDRMLKNVTIHKKSRKTSSVVTVIKAEEGELRSSENSNLLQLILRNGYYYEDVIPKKYEERRRVPFAKAQFKEYVINLDLGKLNPSESAEETITNTNSMLNIAELHYTIDSLQGSYDKQVKSYADNAYERTGLPALFRKNRAAVSPVTPAINVDTTTVAGRDSQMRVAINPAVQRRLDSIAKARQLAVKNKNKKGITENITASTDAFQLGDDLLKGFPKNQQIAMLKMARGNAESLANGILMAEMERNAAVKHLNNHYLALHDKFVIAYACLLMFFIGAPLGAIIRKGGLGLPIIFAVLIFIIFHFVNTFGKKLAQSDSISPFLGAWMSSIVLTPLAVTLMYRASNDMGIFQLDFITDPIVHLINKLRRLRTKSNTTHEN